MLNVEQRYEKILAMNAECQSENLSFIKLLMLELKTRDGIINKLTEDAKEDELPKKESNDE